MISVILPVYNVEKYLEECLNSLYQQNNHQLQVIIVDDGSTDSSSTIANKYCQLAPKIFEYYKKENGGLSDARNYGLRYIKGDYVWFVDSDDFVSPQSLEHIEDCIQTNNPDVIIFDYIDFYSKEHQNEYDVLSGKSRFIDKKEYLLSNPCAWNKVIKTRILKENNILFPKGIWYEDRATTGQYINYSDHIYYLNEYIYMYRQRENSIMNQSSYSPKMMDILRAITLMNENIDQQVYGKELEYITVSNLIYQSGLRLLPFNKYDELKKCIELCKNLYPHWENNIYIKKRSLFFRKICIYIYTKKFKKAILIIKLQDIIRNIKR